MAFICVFFPAVIMCGVRNFTKKNGKREKLTDRKQILLEYVCCCVFLNLLLLVFLALFRQNTQNIYEKLNISSVFAIKYLVSSVFAAVAVPFLEQYLRKNVTISFVYDRNSFGFPISPVAGWLSQYGLYILAIIAVGMHFLRIFDNAFWCDEALPILTQVMSFKGMLRQVATWGHTPLHYAIIWVLYRIFGASGPMYHFVSLVPYILIVLVSVTIVRKWFGKRTAAILILLSTLLENAIQYNVEVRMYSWCQIFIFLAFLMMYQILRTGKMRYFVFMTLCSLGAVYSHSFALAVVGILYLFLLLYVVAKNRKNSWKVFLSGGAVPLLFLPWLLYERHVLGKFVAEYGGLTNMEWKTCFEYVFSSRYSLLILALFTVLFFTSFLRDTGILKFQSGYGLCLGSAYRNARQRS